MKKTSNYGKPFKLCSLLTSLALLSACVTTADTQEPNTQKNSVDKITRAEAKELACPAHILAAGASPADCSCVESHLYTLGQKAGAIKYDQVASKAGIGGEQGKREIAIGILRLDAFEYCGLLDPSHAVSKNLQSPAT